jgi:penicillin-binding protein 1A
MKIFFARVKFFAERFVLFFKAQTLFKKIIISIGLFLTSVFVFVIGLVFFVWVGVFGPIPNRTELEQVQNPAATEIYSADSVLLGRYFIQERSNIHSQDIPKSLEDALLATEDIRFYDHHGVDLRSLFRVLVKSILLQQESSGGGSTITQQLAKNLYPRRSYWFLEMPINKIREMIIAWRFENIYSKKEILTLYLNTIPFADNTYGIEAASQRFFSVPTKRLTTEQAAVLVGMLKATYAYNPRVFPVRAQRRRNVVLQQMRRYQFLSSAEEQQLQAIPLTLKYNNITHHSGLAPYFREYIRPQLIEWCKQHKKDDGKPYNLYTDGLKVYTTIDSRLQRYAEQAVTRQMSKLQERFRQHWGKRDPWYNQQQVFVEAVKRSERYQRLSQQGLSEEEIRKVMSTPVVMTVFTWEGEKEVKMSPLDSIEHYLKFLNAGFLAMDAHKGNILAWVGGINHHYFQFDHIKESTKRQVGSTFKPIVYAAALEKNVRPCDFVSAERMTYANVSQGADWSPKNSEDNYDLKYSMEGALAFSVNTVSVRILEKAGIDNAIQLAQRMGIRSDLPAVPSLALGVANISMEEMVKAYACFVNDGKTVEPYWLSSITTTGGDVLERFKSEQRSTRALSAKNAQLMLNMLKRTVNEGTAGSLRSQYGISNDLAAKTGTTQSNADGWFIAMTPQIVMGAWVGADDPRIRFRTTSLGQGSKTALPITADFIQQVNHDKKVSSWVNSHFPPLPDNLENELACELYKSDLTLIEKIFGKPDNVPPAKKQFGEQTRKDGFLKRLFRRRN